MHSKGSRFTLGVCGLSCVRQTLRNRSQPTATVRNRSRKVAMAVPMGSFAKGLSFGAFPCGIASVRVAGVALRDIPTCFMTCQKIVLRRRPNTSATFSEDALNFS